MMDAVSEDIPLIEKATSSHRSVLARRYHTTQKCVSSKVALLILLWSCPVALIYGLGFNPDGYVHILNLSNKVHNYILIPYGLITFIWCFFPCAGFLADIKFGRYKTVVFSSYVFIIGLCLPFTLPLAIVVGYVGFTANVIQFGMDQLHDSPGEDRTLFIHWYWWVFYSSYFITQLSWIIFGYDNDGVYKFVGIALVSLLAVIAIVLLIISMCLGHHKRRWFLIEPGRVNPYKLVYRVTKFSCQHRIPVQRSAFTYCEDKLPSGLDLGKDKYGGPFTTEEVEDVKAFYGILKVLFSFGPVFLLDITANSLCGFYYFDGKNYIDNGVFFFLRNLLITKGVLSLLLIVLCIPLYLLLLRPFISHYIPGMLKRMGIGIIIVLTSLIMIFSTTILPDFIFHRNSTMLGSVCCTSNCTSHSIAVSVISDTSLLAQNILSALSNMLIYISAVEFICSQSPSSMTGLLIGVFYTIKGLFQLIATALVAPFLSCFSGNWLAYSLVNIVIGVVAFVVYVCVARRYKYRERGEPCNIHQYAEEYYSNPQQEKYYDYD